MSKLVYQVREGGIALISDLAAIVILLVSVATIGYFFFSTIINLL